MPKNTRERNEPYVKQGTTDAELNTQLPFLDEMAFRAWLAQNKVPFDPEASVSDYDMRGFYRALQSGDPRAASAVNPNDNRPHYPDTYKTPYHDSFSEGSRWAGPVAPKWTEDDKLVSPSARILLDERAPSTLRTLLGF